MLDKGVEIARSQPLGTRGILSCFPSSEEEYSGSGASADVESSESYDCDGYMDGSHLFSLYL